MATTLLIECNCGQPLMVYIPKTTLFEHGLIDLGTLEEYQEMDREEIEAGELELSKMNAGSMGFSFVDSRDTEVWICPNCKRQIRTDFYVKSLFDHAKTCKTFKGPETSSPRGRDLI